MIRNVRGGGNQKQKTTCAMVISYKVGCPKKHTERDQNMYIPKRIEDGSFEFGRGACRQLPPEDAGRLMAN